MSVVVKNTFLDIASHKFLHFEDGPCRADRRSQSAPRKWAPVTPSARTPLSSKHVSLNSTDASSQSSPRSNCSFFSAVASFEHCCSSPCFESPEQYSACSDTDITPRQSLPGIRSSIGDIADCDLPPPNEADLAAGPCMECKTPMDSYELLECYSRQWGSQGKPGSPCEPKEEPFSSRCREGSDQMNRVLCYLTGNDALCYDCSSVGAQDDAAAVAGTSPCHIGPDLSSVVEHVPVQQEPEHEPAVCMQEERVTSSLSRTCLKRNAPAFHPVPADARTDAVVNAAYLSLVSCGQLKRVTMDRGIQGQSPTLLSAQLEAPLHATNSGVRCYDAMQLVKQSLEAITSQLPTVSLLSARVQKEDFGYSLRASIACLPEGAEGSMCWDMFQKGYCGRRSQCRWYHPQDSDISKLKVTIRYFEPAQEYSSSSEETESSSERHKLVLGDLV